MADHDVQIIPIWDVTRSTNLAWLRHMPRLVDCAVSLYQDISLDGNGLAFDLFSPDDFFAYFGTHPQPLPPMGPAVGNAAQLAMWHIGNDDFRAQAKGKVTLRNIVIASLPKELLVSMQDQNRSIRSRTTQYIVSTLSAQLGTLTKEDIGFLMCQLKEPYRVGTSVPFFLADWNASLLDLERARQALPQVMATDILMGCFGSEFAICWLTFVKDNPIIINRTVARLCAAITLFAVDALPLITAQSAISISLVTKQTAVLVQMQGQIDDLRQALVAAQALPASGKKRGAPPAADTSASPVRAARPRRAPTHSVPLFERYSINNNNNNTMASLSTRASVSRQKQNNRRQLHPKEQVLAVRHQYSRRHGLPRTSSTDVSVQTPTLAPRVIT